MNGRSIWQHLKTRWLTGSLALSLGLAGTVATQYPDTLPPIPTPHSLHAVPAASEVHHGSPPQAIVGTPVAVQKEVPTERPVAPPPAAMPAPVEMAPGCATCGTGRRGGGCSSCGGGGGYGGPGCGCVSYPCGYHGCFPGHQNCCDCCEHDGPIGRFFCCFYNCLCCPDPCYEPCYRIEANSAFWVDGARPATMTRFRWDSGHNFLQPDRSEFFWAASGRDITKNVVAKGPPKLERSMKYDALMFYQEAATGKASVFIEQEYRTVDPDVNNHASGFGDMNIGTKALLFDCELMQVTFQFRTFIPIGNFRKGLGTGHVSLEPSLLTAVKLMPETYFQSQVSEWIPIASDPVYGGAVLHYHFSLNHVLWRPLADMPVIGVLEANGYSFQDGSFTDSIGVARLSSGDTWWSAGPGLRVSICNKIDFGFSAMFGLSDGNPEQLYRSEMRLRF